MNRYLTPDEVADRIGFSVKTLANWRSLTRTSGEQQGPRWQKFGTQAPYPEGWVEEWLEATAVAA